MKLPVDREIQLFSRCQLKNIRISTGAELSSKGKSQLSLFLIDASTHHCVCASICREVLLSAAFCLFPRRETHVVLGKVNPITAFVFFQNQPAKPEAEGQNEVTLPVRLRCIAFTLKTRVNT